MRSIDPRLLNVSNAIIEELTPPPRRHQPGTCWRCRTWNDQSEEPVCSNCSEVAEALGFDAVPIDVITLYRKPSQLREWLTGYKGRSDGTEPLVAGFEDIITALIGRFLHMYFAEIHARSAVDCIVVVPSTDREPPHPLEILLGRLDFCVPVLPLLIRGSGLLGFRQPSRDGYIATGDTKPKRVLLVDDVYTTGAHVNSAANALKAGGHTVAGAAVIARRVNVDFAEDAAAFWEQQSSQPFEWSTSPIVNERSP